MARPLVVLADPDYAYLAPLELKFLEELGERIDLEVITDEAYLSTYLASPHDIEALLIDEAWYDDRVSLQNVSSLFVLTEERDADRTSNLSVDYTFKYTSLGLIYNKVVSSCARLAPEEAVGEARVLLFFSPVGGAGTTTAAMAVAACLRGSYRRVLYVDAECLQTFAWRLSEPQVASMDMVRGMQHQPRDAYEAVRPYLATECFDYVPPLRSSLASAGMDLAFYCRLVEGARASGDYDYVVVDADTALTPEKVELLGMADRVAVMVGQDDASRHKLARLMANIDDPDADTYRFFCNAYRAEFPNAFLAGEGAPVELDGFIEYDEEVSHMDVVRLGEVPGFRRLAQSLE